MYLDDVLIAREAAKLSAQRMADFMRQFDIAVRWLDDTSFALVQEESAYELIVSVAIVKRVD